MSYSNVSSKNIAIDLLTRLNTTIDLKVGVTKTEDISHFMRKYEIRDEFSISKLFPQINKWMNDKTVRKPFTAINQSSKKNVVLEVKEDSDGNNIIWGSVKNLKHITNVDSDEDSNGNGEGIDW